jgi:ribosomal protein L21E
MRYKVGDMVVVICVDPKWAKSSEYPEYLECVGRTGIITEVDVQDQDYTLNWPKHWYWNDSEVELAKPHIINKILSEI